MLTQTSKSQKSFNNDPPQRSQKSRSRLHLQKTPSMVMPHNPYVEQLGDRSTSKKRRDNSVSFVPPILLDQNKQLLTQNRQMATIIQEKNAAIDALQTKLDQRAQAEIAIFRQVEAEKKRLIQQILAHKQATDQQIGALAQEVSTVQQEKASLQRQFQMQIKKQELALQQQRQKEMDQVRLQHQQAIAVLKAEHSKLKEQAQRKANDNQIRELQSKQKLNEANSRCESLTEELKHLQQVRRLQQAQQKTHYQARIQKLHLQNRREKELFLIQHESQVKRLQDEVKRLKRTIQDLQASRQDLRENMEVQKVQKENYQEKVLYEAEASIDNIKKVTLAERQKMEGLLKTEITLLQASNQQEVAHLQGENRRLAQLVSLKQREIQRLLKEIDDLRSGRLAQLQQNQKLVRELQSKLLNSLLEGETENQALKTKLARLREADLTGLRNYYQNQIQLLARGLQQKETALSALRQKQQQQLRKKIEMRKGFDLETLRYKSRIIQLQNEIQSLGGKLKQTEEEMRRQAESAIHEAQRETGSKAKAEQFKNDQCKQLQAIITAKDIEIEELTRRLELLKEHHALQRTGWHSELQAEKNLHLLTKTEKAKVFEISQAELARLKEKGRKEREQFERDLQMLKEEHRGDFDAVMTQLAAQRELNEEQRQRLLLQLKKKELQIQKLSNLLASRQKDIQTLQNAKKQQIITDLSKQKTELQDFYSSKLKLKQEQTIDLLQRIQQLTSDLRDARQNYNDLQRRMEQLIQSQSQLREVQRKVIAMGKENNLLKNMQQILKQAK